MIERIIKDLNKAITEENQESFLRNLVAYNETKKNTKKHSLVQIGIQHPERLLTIFNPTKKEDAVREIAEQYLDYACEKGIKLVDRKKNIDAALRILFDFYKEKEGNVSPSFLICIARAYYLASLTIFPKEMTIPEKKKEALRKGITFVDHAIEKLHNPPSGNEVLYERAFRTKGMLFMEYNRIDKDKCDDRILKNILTEARNNGCNKFSEYEEDVRIAVRLCELEGNSVPGFEEIITSTKANNLEKAKISYLLNKGDGQIKTYMNACIKTLKRTLFSHRLWEETVNFIKRLKDDKSLFWKDFALEAYESCRIQEGKTDIFRLRWYWSRQRDLYDLAFIAAREKNDKKKMAEISDSLKSRSSLRLSAWEKLAGSEGAIKKFLESYETTAMGGFIPDFGECEDIVKEIEGKPPEQIDLTDVPKGWIVVHFYINRMEGKGYAIAYDKDRDDWQYKCFPYVKLFNTFLTWQANYHLYKDKAAKHLIELCKVIGKFIPLLFHERFISSNKDILFIPHDFLHRLPLHGAIKYNTNKVFLENHACCYLPAWSFVAKETGFNTSHHVAQAQSTISSHTPCLSNKKTEEHKHVLLKNFEEHDKRYFKNILPPNMNWNPCKILATHEDLKNITLPELLVILCHGKADMANPLRSGLLLMNGVITHLEILKSVKDLKGCQVILGACETDLVPPLSGVIDEHPSVVTAFLMKEVREILGTMWEVYPEKVEKIVIEVKEKIITNTPFYKVINKWQKTKLTSGNDASFYDVIPFRAFTIYKQKGLQNEPRY